MVSVIIKPGGIFNDRGDPYSCKTERLDIVEFVDKTFEVASPFGVVDIEFSVPAICVVGTVPVVETGGHCKIDGFIAEIGTAAYKSSGG